jgi:Zn-dependent metalloprotease
MFYDRVARQCIVPPHMMRHLLEKGDPRLRAAALRTLIDGARVRGRREIFGMLPSAVPAGEKHRTIYDAGHSSDLPGVKVRDEGGGPARDSSANEAYDGLGATYDLYHEVYERNSIDNKGLRLDASVHYQVDYDNAFWDGRQMVFGDGDGVLFIGFTKAIDVIGHELTHGVTQYECGLEYHDEPGALNESISDVFGSLVKQYALGQDVNAADWLIGSGILARGVHGVALRSMKDPGTAYDDEQLGRDPQPANYKNYVRTSDDNGGVHINSGIPNRAFYLTAVAIGGHAWEQAGAIWYHSLHRLQPQSDFQHAANTTFQVAGELYGAGSAQQQAVREGWTGVGIKISGLPRVGKGRMTPRQVVDVDAVLVEKQVERITAKLTDKIVDALGEKIIDALTEKLEASVK